ncbi:MAG: acetate--CoA ligase family protein [Proteobacteria bacterium]|nr:acetate--CoA ligase family protein [Pseudomonadota bacterium]
MSSWNVICDSAELAVECANGARGLGLAIAPRISRAAVKDALSSLKTHEPTALGLLQPPSLDQVVHLAYVARGQGQHLVLAVLNKQESASTTRDAALDLGICAVDEVRPLLALLALLRAGARAPWTAKLGRLPDADRQRLRAAVRSGSDSDGELQRVDDAVLTWKSAADAAPVALGEARDVAAALAALRTTCDTTAEVESTVDGVESQAVLDVIYGPRRALSDPASKAALRPYGLPLPVEELCTSASRAAAEASRIGFPVRIALASPDLRIWEHPDLTVQMVDNAARVREVFRLLMGLGQQRAPGERLLGVTVASATIARALLGVAASPLVRGRIAMQIGFADPHGAASGDATTLVLPAPISAIARGLARLRGARLVLDSRAAVRDANVESIADVLLRLAAFMNDRRAEVETVEMRPLALLPDGSAEVREALVMVGDAFERRMLRGGLP